MIYKKSLIWSLSVDIHSVPSSIELSKYSKLIMRFYKIGFVIMPISILITISSFSYLILNPSIYSELINTLTFKWVVFSVIISYIIHESGHLLVSIADDDLKPKSIGVIFLLVIPVGAFVDAADELFSYRRTSAGITNNILISILTLPVGVYLNSTILITIGLTNLLFTFNSLPVFELDGGQYLYIYVALTDNKNLMLLIATVLFALSLLCFIFLNVFGLLIGFVLMYTSYRWIEIYKDLDDS